MSRVDRVRRSARSRWGTRSRGAAEGSGSRWSSVVPPVRERGPERTPRDVRAASQFACTVLWRGLHARDLDLDGTGLDSASRFPGSERGLGRP